MWSTTDVILLLLLAICLFTDLREGKIYNKHTFPVFLLALTLSVIEGGLPGLKFSFLGAAAGLVIMLVPYLLGGMGAGDVKLVMVIGALKGAGFTLQAALATFIVGGLIAAVLITYRRQWLQTFSRLKEIIFLLFVIPTYKKYNYGSPALHADFSFPYGIAITAGTLIVLLMG